MGWPPPPQPAFSSRMVSNWPNMAVSNSATVKSIESIRWLNSTSASASDGLVLVHVLPPQLLRLSRSSMTTFSSRRLSAAPMTGGTMFLAKYWGETRSGSW